MQCRIFKEKTRLSWDLEGWARALSVDTSPLQSGLFVLHPSNALAVRPPAKLSLSPSPLDSPQLRLSSHTIHQVASLPFPSMKMALEMAMQILRIFCSFCGSSLNKTLPIVPWIRMCCNQQSRASTAS
jgi:hypothetical protein